MGSRRGHVTQFWNFGIPLISRGGIKLETSNLAPRWTTVSTNEKNAKLVQKESCCGHVTHFWNFGTPPNISETVKARNFKFGAEMDGSEY